MITISDVAAKAGVSRATVSYVLNERDTTVRISDDTRRRVLETATQLGYRRNELARAVTTGKNRMLGFWVMQANREPVIRVLAGAIREADANDYFIKMIGFEHSALDARTLERCVEWRLSGIIAIHAPGHTMKDLYPRIRETGIPLVTVDSQRPPDGCTNIIADGTKGMRAIVSHLAELGHRRIAFLAGQHPHEDSLSEEREAAYVTAMQALNLGDQILIARGDWRENQNNWQSGATVTAVECLLAHHPTAIACASDHLAMITVRLATMRGIDVPRQLSVTGFDDLSVAALYNPPLTTVSQPFETIGQAAVRHLLHPDHSVQPEWPLPARLVVRASTAQAQA
jgi:DNA-binding LacI/PurR family transcriptional regulator